MRPYQIVAAERILQRIETSTNHRQLGTRGGGRLHLAHHRQRQDADQLQDRAAGARPAGGRQGAVRGRPQGPGLPDHARVRPVREGRGQLATPPPRVLQKQLEDPNARIIITTIQKLARFVGQNKEHPIYDGHVVVIFDECHRSQFGDMHAEITRAFKRYHLFGFTGTPIFADNAGTGGNPLLRTTEQAFGDKLHTYTIVDAINDKNVLPFRIDYINTIKTSPSSITDKQVAAIDTERALLAPERISQVVGYIREHFDQKTKRAAVTTAMDGKRVAGLQLAVRHRLHRRRQALLRRVHGAAGKTLPAGAAAQGRPDLQLRRQRGRRRRPAGRGGVRDRGAGPELARLSGRRDPGLQRPVRHQLRHLVPTSSRTTTRTCRSG